MKKLQWVKVDFFKKKVSTNTAQPQNQRWVTVKKWGLSQKKTLKVIGGKVGSV